MVEVERLLLSVVGGVVALLLGLVGWFFKKDMKEVKGRVEGLRNDILKEIDVLKSRIEDIDVEMDEVKMRLGVSEVVFRGLESVLKELKDSLWSMKDRLSRLEGVIYSRDSNK